MKIKNKYIREVSHWTIFIAAALVMTIKVVEVSAHESLKIYNMNPECSMYSSNIR